MGKLKHSGLAPSYS